MKSLMNTEAGKLQGNLWSWGVIKGRRAIYGNYSLKDEDGPEPAVGTAPIRSTCWTRSLMQSQPILRRA